MRGGGVEAYLEGVVPVALRRAGAERRLDGRGHASSIGDVRVVVVVVIDGMGPSAPAAALVGGSCKETVDTGASGRHVR